MILCNQCQSKPSAPNRTICHGCRSLNYRTKFPEKKAFYDLRHSARRRHVPFTLTFEEFLSLVIPTGYMEKRGRFWDSLTIDRIRNNKGYIPGNIRVVQKTINSQKRDKENYPF